MRTVYPEIVDRALKQFDVAGKATLSLEEYQALAEAKLVKASISVWFSDPPPETVSCVLTENGWDYLMAKQNQTEKMAKEAAEKINAKRAKMLHFFFEIFKLLLAGAIALAVEHYDDILAFFHDLFSSPPVG